jgi:hypothetical protein
MLDPTTIRMLAAAVAALSLVLAARSEIIDRIAVSVGNQVITQSEIRREIRLTAFLNRQPAVFTAEARRRAADRLVEQKLVRKELEWSRFPLPAEDSIEPQWKALVERAGGEEALQKELDSYRLTEEDLKEHLLWQQTLLSFIDERFRPGIQVTDADIREYFRETILPLEKVAHPGMQARLEDYRDQIEKVIMGQRIDQELNDWLTEARKRTKVEYREEAFQ